MYHSTLIYKCLYIQFSSVQFSSVAQSCPTLCDPMNRSTPGIPVHHHLPEFTQTHVHRVRDAIQPRNVISNVLLVLKMSESVCHSVMSDSLQSHGLQPARLLCPWDFSRQEYSSGSPVPSPGDLPNPDIEPRSLELQGDSLSSEPPGVAPDNS